MNRTPFGWISLLLVVLTVLTGCSEDKQSTALNGRAAHIYAAGQRILGFEDHNDWSNSNANSTVHSEGAKSIEVVSGGWVQVESVPMSSLGIPLDKISVDVRLPEMPQWGDMTIIVKKVPPAQKNTSLTYFESMMHPSLMV